MGLITFNERYYREELEKLENRVLSSEEVYKAKQLLKILDDLADEGYTNLNTRMENDFSCLTRLRRVIEEAGELPFKVNKDRLSKTIYGPEEFSLNIIMDRLLKDAVNQNICSQNPFLQDIRDYCKWIGHEENTAYVFLFRDALLPYLYFRNQNFKNIYGWLISRKFLTDLTKTIDVDDNIRLPIYEALEAGCNDFNEFRVFCKDKILSVLDLHVGLKRVLLTLLNSIKEKRIIVIESGYCGTIPMMLNSLDDRVSFKMFTTAPFLKKVYQENIYCCRYEDIRNFETLYSQDLLLEYSSYRNGIFYVRLSKDTSVLNRSLSEIKFILE